MKCRLSKGLFVEYDLVESFQTRDTKNDLQMRQKRVIDENKVDSDNKFKKEPSSGTICWMAAIEVWNNLNTLLVKDHWKVQAKQIYENKQLNQETRSTRTQEEETES